MLVEYNGILCSGRKVPCIRKFSLRSKDVIMRSCDLGVGNKITTWLANNNSLMLNIPAK